MAGFQLTEMRPRVAGFARPVTGGQGLVQFPSRIHSRVGQADLLNFFQIEEPWAVQERMQGHDPERGIGDGQGNRHAMPPTLGQEDDAVFARTIACRHRMRSELIRDE
jgi:hypothetical protein